MTAVIMPRLSDSMEEGTILRWLKSTGEQVAVGDPIAEIETDKATMTYEADAAGFLQIVAAEGDTLAIGAVIANLVGSAEEAGQSAAPAVASEPEPAAEPAAQAEPAAAEPQAAEAVEEEFARSQVTATAAVATGGRVKASPVARRIAAELGVDLASVSGSGPDGRIVKADVVTAANGAGSRAAVAPAAAVSGDADGAKGAVEVIEPTRTQQLIARRMASAKATIPEFQVTVEVDAEAAFELREQLRGQTEPLPSVNDLIVKACALALRAHPGVNASYVDGHFERYGRVNIGVAVAGPDTLVVPTVFDADVKPLTVIAATTRELASKVRDGTVSPPELAGATFTVSNLGMLGVARFTAVIDPPQSAILAVGAANPRAVVGADGAITARRVMELTISADHRIVYGADAADFLATVRKRLERPAGLLL
ncbi:MAG TPA: dihydrolipoamide acetyltransferase family protein [Solirubrobacteraceae bacterium]|jgi:pyruvate dehydrogenase E2 component (dihydrolipoamide acetyltransferase)|nr:dihydrolipoamide acetyltransferase family protein [Solirubrobacteraceae bacterium]